MITVPVSTLEKPITVVDYIAALNTATTIDEVQQYSEQLPVDILQDERYTRAVAVKVAAINQARRSQRRVA